VCAQVTLWCACPEDCNSQSKVCDTLYGDGESCIPGCFPPGQQCVPGGRSWECSFPPHQLADALRAQQASPSMSGRNNEMVIDVRSVVRHLPYSVEAFFFLSSMPDASSVRAARDKFVRVHRLAAEVAPPLVRVSFENAITGDAPFELVE
jgi:hypothetical protein